MIIYKEIKKAAQELNGNEFKVLMVMANDWAVMNKDEYYYRSMEDLAKDTNVSRRTLFRVVEGLKEKGYIDAIRRYGTPNWYKVNIIATEFDSAKMALSNKTDSAKIDTIDSAKMAPKKKKEKEVIEPCKHENHEEKKEKINKKENHVDMRTEHDVKKKDYLKPSEVGVIENQVEAFNFISYEGDSTKDHDTSIPSAEEEEKERLAEVLKAEEDIASCVNYKGKGGLYETYEKYQGILTPKDTDNEEVRSIISKVNEHYRQCEEEGKALVYPKDFGYSYKPSELKEYPKFNDEDEPFNMCEGIW